VRARRMNFSSVERIFPSAMIFFSRFPVDLL
jgi:hypothetical protein